MTNLKQVETHFKFGENWKNFSTLINEERIEEAKKSLIKFFGPKGVQGKTFLDIGCGSGLFSLAALLLGAKHVTALDIDKDSVATTKSVLESFAPNKNFDCFVESVFDLNPKKHGTFDIVYSWGVLHHTGDMFKAIEKAISMIKLKGLLAIALYKKTPMCWFWKIEKSLYTNSPKWIQSILRGMWYAAWVLVFGIIFRNNLFSYVKNYKSSRGMSFSHDVHDWLGGYPYESIAPDEMHAFAEKNSLIVSSEFLIPACRLGLLGTGCDEYVFQKK